MAEYAKYLRRAGVVPGHTRPRELVSIFDLTDPAASPIPLTSSFLLGDSEDDLEQCRSLADYIRSQSYAGIVAPSSALPSDKNLIIYYDGLASAIPTLLEGPDRFAITPDGTI